MSREAHLWMERIRTVEKEHGAIRFGIDHLIRAANDNPAVLGDRVERRDLIVASERLEGTYLVRVFAEFETALRLFVQAMNMAKPMATESLINRIRDRVNIKQNFANDVHKVREYRNALIHERSKETPSVTIREATSWLGRFLSHLDRIW